MNIQKQIEQDNQLIKNNKIPKVTDIFEQIKNDDINYKITLVKNLENLKKNREALRFLRKTEKLGVERSKIEIVRILTELRKYKFAYRYIRKKLNKEERFNYYEDIKKIAFELTKIGKYKEALILFRGIDGIGIGKIKKHIIEIFKINQKYMSLYRYIMTHFKEQWYKYLNNYIFNINIKALSDKKLLELEKIYWKLLKNPTDIKVVSVEIGLAKIYCCRNIGFINRAEFMNLIYNKIHDNSNLMIGKIYNAILNSLERISKTIFLKSKPIEMCIQLTTKCNAKCMFCDFSNSGWELPSRSYKEILELLPTLINVNWLGGEVFLYKHFKELFKKAKQYNVRQEIITNGMLLTEEWIEELICANVDLAISIRSTEKEKYEYLTEGANFEKLISKLEYLNKQLYKRNKNFRLSMFSLITKYNYMELEKIIEFAHKYNFNLVRFIQLDNIENSQKSPNICDPKSKEYDKLIISFNKAVILANRYGIKIKNELPLNVKNEELINNERILAPINNEYIVDGHTLDIGYIYNIRNIFCSYPWRQIQIDNGGDVFFNCFCYKNKGIFGNVNKQTILEIWNSEQVINFRKKIIDNNYKDICNTMCINNSIHNK